MYFPILYLYPLLTLLACKTSATHALNEPEEYLRLRSIVYRLEKGESIPYMTFLTNIWYQDSIGITQLSSLQSVQTDTTEQMLPVEFGYRFVDMRKKWAYEYRNLSDTAEVVRKYEIKNGVQMENGWNFFRKSVIVFDSLRVVGDTSINGTIFRKYRFVQTFNGMKLLGEAFARCDRKGTIFVLDVGLSNAAGCPVVMGNSLTPDGKLPTSSVEIELVSNTFPDSVRRAFAAWKRNVEQSPVH